MISPTNKPVLMAIILRFKMILAHGSSLPSCLPDTPDHNTPLVMLLWSISIRSIVRSLHANNQKTKYFNINASIDSSRSQVKIWLSALRYAKYIITSLSKKKKHDESRLSLHLKKKKQEKSSSYFARPPMSNFHLHLYKEVSWRLSSFHTRRVTEPNRYQLCSYGTIVWLYACSKLITPKFSYILIILLLLLALAYTPVRDLWMIQTAVMSIDHGSSASASTPAKLKTFWGIGWKNIDNVRRWLKTEPLKIHSNYWNEKFVASLKRCSVSRKKRHFYTFRFL